MPKNLCPAKRRPRLPKRLLFVDQSPLQRPPSLIPDIYYRGSILKIYPSYQLSALSFLRVLGRNLSSKHSQKFYLYFNVGVGYSCQALVILSDMDAEIAALDAKLTKTRQLKQGMMQRLLTVKIRLI